MTTKDLAWPLWIVGTVLIVLSWLHMVSYTVGWIGFGIVMLGWWPRGESKPDVTATENDANEPPSST